MSVTTTITNADTLVPTDGNPDPELFYELVSQATFRSHLLSKPDALSSASFCIEKHETLSKNKFDLLIHQGAFKNGEVLGVAKFHVRGLDYTIGLGNPAGEIEGKGITWEKLTRLGKYTHKVHYFSIGSAEQRRTYTYRKQYTRFKRLKTMELRAGGIEDEKGELLARWVGTSKLSMKRGSLFIKRIGLKGQEPDAPLDEEARKWEIMVCMTAFTIIESQVRRSKG
jgi:hypothetical protein